MNLRKLTLWHTIDWYASSVGTEHELEQRKVLDQAIDAALAATADAPPKEPTCAHCGILVSGCECPVILSRYAPPSDAAPVTAETLAQRFHEEYERLAPQFGYKTREASAVPWEEVPESNRRLMVAVAEKILQNSPPPSDAAPVALTLPLVEKLAVVLHEAWRETDLGGDCFADMAEAVVKLYAHPPLEQADAPGGPWEIGDVYYIGDVRSWYLVAAHRKEKVGPLESQAEAIAVRDALNSLEGDET